MRVMRPELIGRDGVSCSRGGDGRRSVYTSWASNELIFLFLYFCGFLGGNGGRELMGTKTDLLYKGSGNMVTKRLRRRIEHVVWELLCMST